VKLNLVWLYVGDALTQNVWHEIPVINIIANTNEISSIGNYILLSKGHYQVTLIAIVYDTTVSLDTTLFTDIYDVDLNKEVDYSLNIISGRQGANASISILTSTIIIITTETSRIIPRIMTNRLTMFLGAFPAGIPTGSINFCMRTVITKL